MKLIRGVQSKITEQLAKEEKSKYFKKLFYEKWGSYENYLKHNPPKPKIKQKSRVRNNLYLQVIKDELWVSPAGTKEKFFLTKGKITMKEIKNFKPINICLKQKNNF